jgi:hypothetical protein
MDKIDEKTLEFYKTHKNSLNENDKIEEIEESFKKGIPTDFFSNLSLDCKEHIEIRSKLLQVYQSIIDTAIKMKYFPKDLLYVLEYDGPIQDCIMCANYKARKLYDFKTRNYIIKFSCDGKRNPESIDWTNIYFLKKVNIDVIFKRDENIVVDKKTILDKRAKHKKRFREIVDANKELLDIITDKDTEVDDICDIVQDIKKQKI